MDIMMPGEFDGVEATRILKSDPRTLRSRIIILSGKDVSQVLEEARRAGADFFLSKPFSPLELLRRLDAALESNFKT